MTDDVYQTAKVAKVLLLLNAGKRSELKRKSLAGVEVAAEEVIEFDEKDPDEENYVLVSSYVVTSSRPETSYQPES